MKKIGLILGLLCFGLVAMVSCDKDDNKQVEVPAKEIKISKDAVNVLVGETQVIDITDGNGGYKVKSSDENKAVASVKGEKQIAVEGKNVGEATLTITDSKQKSITIKVTVSDFFTISYGNKYHSRKIWHCTDFFRFRELRSDFRRCKHSHC
ncbi:hypothetical protein QIU18_07745 [Capnocytophaga canimorsus]|nr:hypothetical protein [Capnocytophaga canimorsus]WGU69598.1 hypothetical protein QIU18_07745 [Capnocytophaga canimorsus]